METERVTVDQGVAPEVALAPHLGPGPVQAERDHNQQQVDDPDAEVLATGAGEGDVQTVHRDLLQGLGSRIGVFHVTAGVVVLEAAFCQPWSTPPGHQGTQAGQADRRSRAADCGTTGRPQNSPGHGTRRQDQPRPGQQAHACRAGLRVGPGHGRQRAQQQVEPDLVATHRPRCACSARRPAGLRAPRPTGSRPATGGQGPVGNSQRPGPGGQNPPWPGAAAASTARPAASRDNGSEGGWNG
jgi:hypothetical protein